MLIHTWMILNTWLMGRWWFIEMGLYFWDTPILQTQTLFHWVKRGIRGRTLHTPPLPIQERAAQTSAKAGWATKWALSNCSGHFSCQFSQSGPPQSPVLSRRIIHNSIHFLGVSYNSSQKLSRLLYSPRGSKGKKSETLTLDIQGYPVRIGVWTPRTSKGSFHTDPHQLCGGFGKSRGHAAIFCRCFFEFRTLGKSTFPEACFFGNRSQHHQPQTSIPQKKRRKSHFQANQPEKLFTGTLSKQLFYPTKKAQSDNLWKLTAGSPQSGMVFPSSGSSPFPGGPFSGSSFFFCKISGWSEFWLPSTLSHLGKRNIIFSSTFR